MSTPVSRDWHRAQVRTFNDDRGNHKDVAGVLESVLQAIRRRTDPTAMVQVRPKALASFAEKAIRKKNKYGDPAKQLTDVVGGRIITYTQAGADKVRGLIERLGASAPPQLEIDWDNSVDTTERLKPEEFGYKAMHYIVRMNAPTILGVAVDQRLSRYKVEIQICTMLQHVWSAIGHDRVYKTRLNIPVALKHRLAAISALIDMAQAEFDSGIVALDRYIEQFSPYVAPDSRTEEEMRWESVLAVEPHDQDALLRHADHCASVGEWQCAYEEYRKCDPEAPGILAKRGRVAARMGDRLEAASWLRKAIEKDNKDWAARCDLADLLEQRGKYGEALAEYKQAFHDAPGEPRALVSYVSAIVCRDAQLSCTRALRGALDAAIEECKHRTELQVDLPNAFFYAARCSLFRADLYAALDWYCKASVKCESRSLIDAERQAVEAMTEKLSVDELSLDKECLEHFQCAARLLDLLAIGVGRRARWMNGGRPAKAISGSSGDPPRGTEENDRLEKLATKQEQRPSFGKRPVVIVAGGCDQNVEERMRRYRQTLKDTFADFEGTIICGGTTAGISGIIGEMAKERGDVVCTIGYLPPPDRMPKGDQRDEERYHTICDVDLGHVPYSPAGPIQTWADLLLAGVQPTQVRLLGINGGDLSGFEFRLAMAMGASVGLIEDSGRAVSGLMVDPDWKELGRLAALFNEAETLAPFVTTFCPTFQAIPEGERQARLETMARAQHEEYRNGKLASVGYVHESMLPWDKGLDESYKESCWQQVAYADRILRTENFAIVSVDNPQPPEGFVFAENQPTPVNFNDPEFVEPIGAGYNALWSMARREHGRFNAERLAAGWRYGPARDLKAKTSPYLLPWDKLSPEVQEWDRSPFRKLHGFLQPLGLMIVRIVPKEVES